MFEQSGISQNFKKAIKVKKSITEVLNEWNFTIC